MSDYTPQELDFWIHPNEEDAHVYIVSQRKKIRNAEIWYVEFQLTEQEVQTWINRCLLASAAPYNDMSRPAGYYRVLKYKLPSPHGGHFYKDDEQLRQSFRSWVRWLPCWVLWKLDKWWYFNA